jgi:hypothetical protein
VRWGTPSARYCWAVSAPPHTPSKAQRAASIDPGWLFVIAGLAVLACTVLLPALDDLGEARWQRDRAMAIEKHRLVRLERYQQYLEALDHKDRALILSLAATQLNQIPADRSLLLNVPAVGKANASVFPALEPAPMTLPGRTKVDSVLEHLTTNNRTRVWLIAFGGMCLLLGLMPPAGPRRVAAAQGAT